MAKIFISYRRADSAASAGRIYDRLAARFGPQDIFKDVDNIPLGVNFADYIQTVLRQCSVQLVIIGPRWLDALTEAGELRLEQPDDLVRLEIETALGLGITVIPVFVEEARMPSATALPETLRSLALINSAMVRNDPDFAHDINRLITAIEQAISQNHLSHDAQSTAPAPNAPFLWFRYPRPAGAARADPPAMAAIVVVQPHAVDFGQLVAGQRGTLAITISGQGNVPIRGQVIALSPFLHVDRDTFNGPSTVIQVSAETSHIRRSGRQMGSLQIICDRQQLFVPVTVTVVPAPRPAPRPK